MKKTLLLLLCLCLLFTSIISCESPCAHADKQMHPAVAATNENPGNIAYKECSVCHKYFDNVDPLKEITLDSTITYAVIYNENKPGEISATVANMPQGASYQSGSLITKPDSPTLTDCVFGGWYTDSGCTKAFDFTQTKVTLTLTLYAKWILSSVVKDGVQYALFDNNGVSEYEIKGCSADTVKLILLAEIEGIPVTRIADNAFSNKSQLTGDLTIPDSVTSIGVNAFFGCKGFDKTLTIGNSVASIGNYAFWACSGFTDLVYKGEVKPTLGTDVFLGCQIGQ
ncbi:MAG: leucine-rich repeat protein [Spirochaetales bacterium]|nr:leucine-rich repeat protein [Spirochaetales bacterium]